MYLKLGFDILIPLICIFPIRIYVTKSIHNVSTNLDKIILI